MRIHESGQTKQYARIGVGVQSHDSSPAISVEYIERTTAVQSIVVVSADAAYRGLPFCALRYEPMHT